MESGTKLGHYEISTLLGKGGMGEVWRAKDTKLGREVAIKTLPRAFTERPYCDILTAAVVVGLCLKRLSAADRLRGHAAPEISRDAGVAAAQRHPTFGFCRARTPLIAGPLGA